MYKTGIYIRVSTDMQVEDGYSISAQKSILTDYCKAKQWNIAGYYIDEGISGKSLNRNEVKKLLKDIQDGKINNVLVYKIDRITRSTRDLINLVELFQKHNCEFNSLTENIDTSSPAGRGMLKMLAVFAEMERENISQRCSLAQKEKARQGKILNYNNPPYGYKWNKELKTYVIIEEEARVVRLIFELFSKGKSYNQITKYLNLNNLSNGKIWYRNTVKGTLGNCTYIGKVRYGFTKSKEEYFEADGHHPAIIDQDMFKRCQNKIQDISTQNVRKYPKEHATFGNHVYCAECGKRMFARTTYTKYKNTVGYGSSYTCSGYRMGTCTAPSISNLKLMKSFVNNIENIKLDGDVTLEQNSKEMEEINKLINNLVKQKERMKQLYIKDLVSIEEYQDFAIDIDNQIKAHEDTISIIMSSRIDIEKKQQIQEISRNIKENFMQLTKKEKREFVDLFIFRIYVIKENGNVVIKSISFN